MIKFVKRFDKPKDQKGFTLAEAAVAMAVLMITVAVAAGLMMSAGNLFAKNAASDKALQTGEKLCGLLKDKLSCAVSLDISATDDYSTIAVSGEYTERLVISKQGNSVGIARGTSAEQTVIDEKDMGGLRAEIDIEMPDAEAAAVQAEVRLYNEDESCVFSKTFGIPLLNMNDENKADFLTKQISDENAPLVISYGYLE